MSELTKVRKSVIDPTQVIPDMAGHNGKVLSNDGSLPQWIQIKLRIVGELARFSFETPPPGFFALDGSTIPNGKNDFPALANSGSRFITISDNNIVLKNFVDFGRGKGSSGREVGYFEMDDLKNHWHPATVNTDHNYGAGYYGGGTLTSSSGKKSNYGQSEYFQDHPETRPKSLTELVCIYHGVL